MSVIRNNGGSVICASCGRNWPRTLFSTEEMAAGLCLSADCPSNVRKTSNPKDAIATNKTPIHLVSSIAIIYASIAQYLGNVKYGAWNWRGAGIRYSVYYSALMRHMFRWWNGEENDPVDGTPHLANALCCLNIIIEGLYTKTATDDRPPRVNLDEAMKMAEDLMPIIREKYADKDPKHWTISDDVGAVSRGGMEQHPHRKT